MIMDAPFLIAASLTLLSAIAAISLRNLVHCALCLALTFIGLATLYLQLGAQFVGLTQIVVNVGAVAIVIVFAILLTRSGDSSDEPRFNKGAVWGFLIGGGVFGALGAAINASSISLKAAAVEPSLTVKQIGQELMGRYVLPLEAIGLLLTAALIGAVIVAMRETPREGGRK